MHVERDTKHPRQRAGPRPADSKPDADSAQHGTHAEATSGTDSSQVSSDEDDVTSEESTEDEDDDNEEDDSGSDEDESPAQPVDLRSRLAAFLPLMQAANADMERQRSAGELRTLEDLDDDEAHIEMNLGLGVLEEKGTDDESSSTSDAGDDDEEPVMDRLMGHSSLPDQTKRGIQELGHKHE